MDILAFLERLKIEKSITTQQYKTYKGQVMSGDGIGCIKGLKRKRLITDEKADALILLLAHRG